jgi:hypothetical protein
MKLRKPAPFLVSLLSALLVLSPELLFAGRCGTGLRGEQPDRFSGHEPAYRRAVTRGDGFQAIGLDPRQARDVCKRLRRDRPDKSFTISLRTGWDPQGMEPDRIRRELDEYTDAGIQHVVSAPWRSDIDDWLRSMEQLAGLVGLHAA